MVEVAELKELITRNTNIQNKISILKEELLKCENEYSATINTIHNFFKPKPALPSYYGIVGLERNFNYHVYHINPIKCFGGYGVYLTRECLVYVNLDPNQAITFVIAALNKIKPETNFLIAHTHGRNMYTNDTISEIFKNYIINNLNKDEVLYKTNVKLRQFCLGSENAPSVKFRNERNIKELEHILFSFMGAYNKNDTWGREIVEFQKVQ